LADKGITVVSAGGSHTIALAGDGKVYATGRNDYGQLGLNDTTDRSVFTEVASLSGKVILAVSTGDSHTIALASDGKVYAVGHNDYGQLGLNDYVDKDVFTEIAYLADKDIIAVSAGFQHTIALARDGKVYVAGHNGQAQLGLGDYANRNNFTVVAALSDITAVSAGNEHTVALASDGTVYATGIGYFGQLGLGDDADKTVFTPVSGSVDIKDISAANGSYTIALAGDGKVYATGYNITGQLGLGDNANKNLFTPVPNLSGIIAVSAGNGHTVALAGDGMVYAAGDNSNGQLGIGDDNINKNVFTPIPGL
jgi:alpha-tubulin suppressor-like RCC1 family protein